MADVKPPPHDWLVPHNILGDGKITKCQPPCPRYPIWKEEQ